MLSIFVMIHIVKLVSQVAKLGVAPAVLLTNLSVGSFVKRVALRLQTKQ